MSEAGKAPLRRLIHLMPGIEGGADAD